MEMKNILKISGFIVCLNVGIFIGLLMPSFYRIVTGLTVGRHIQTLSTSNYSASLRKKHNLADINFILRVDGKTVYRSADLMSFPDHLYRETLVWDDSGKVVMLELMGKKVFVYDAEKQKELSKDDLKNINFSPMPGEVNYAPIKDISEK